MVTRFIFLELDMLTPEQLAAMKAAAEEGARLKKATRTTFPWKWEQLEDSNYEMRSLAAPPGHGVALIANSHCLGDGNYLSFIDGYPEDFAHIERAANTDYPAMLAAAVAEIERLQAAATNLAAEFRVAGDEWAAVRLETEIFHKEPTT